MLPRATPLTFVQYNSQPRRLLANPYSQSEMTAHVRLHKSQLEQTFLSTFLVCESER